MFNVSTNRSVLKTGGIAKKGVRWYCTGVGSIGPTSFIGKSWDEPKFMRARELVKATHCLECKADGACMIVGNELCETCDAAATLSHRSATDEMIAKVAKQVALEIIEESEAE